MTGLAVLAVLAGVAGIVWGAETFAEHLAAAAAGLGVSTFALALLLAGAEPEELATSVTASLRHSPGIALGDVIGANVTVCLVALGLAAVITPLVFGRQVRRYGLLALPVGAAAVAVSWSGRVTRVGGALLVGLYVAYVAVIWLVERRPPALGEVGEALEARPEGRRRAGPDLALVMAGLAAMVVGASVLVEAVRRLSHVEAGQTKLGLTLVGFATGAELIVLAWSSARRGMSETVLAGVLGSFAYNATMTLGAAALVRPLRLADAGRLHLPWVLMIASLVLVLALALPRGRLTRPGGILLLAAYPAFVVAVLVT